MSDLTPTPHTQKVSIYLLPAFLASESCEKPVLLEPRVEEKLPSLPPQSGAAAAHAPRKPRQGPRSASGHWVRASSLFILTRIEGLSGTLFPFGMVVVEVVVNLVRLEMAFLRFSLDILSLELQEHLCNGDVYKAHICGDFSKCMTVSSLNLWELKLIKN